MPHWLSFSLQILSLYFFQEPYSISKAMHLRLIKAHFCSVACRTRATCVSPRPTGTTSCWPRRPSWWVFWSHSGWCTETFGTAAEWEARSLSAGDWDCSISFCWAVWHYALTAGCDHWVKGCREVTGCGMNELVISTGNLCSLCNLSLRAMSCFCDRTHVVVWIDWAFVHECWKFRHEVSVMPMRWKVYLRTSS